MAKTDIKVVLDEDNSIKEVITTVVNALKNARRNSLAEKFQRDIVSCAKPMMDTVRDYVVLA